MCCLRIASSGFFVCIIYEIYLFTKQTKNTEKSRTEKWVVLFWDHPAERERGNYRNKIGLRLIKNATTEMLLYYTSFL